MERMNLVKRPGSTKSRLQLTGEQYLQLQSSFLNETVQRAQANKVPPQLIINWDQTGLSVSPASSWTMEEEGSQRVEIAGLGDKQQITTTLAIAMSGAVLPVQILYTGKTPKMPSQLCLS